MASKLKNANASQAEHTIVKSLTEFELILNSALPDFPQTVLTEIATFAEFQKEICWRCEDTVWQEFKPEIGEFRIWRSAYCPPEYHTCETCIEESPMWRWNTTFL